MKHLLVDFMEITDPRKGGKRRIFVFKDLIIIVILATLSGINTYVEMEDFAEENYDWLNTFLSLPGRHPSHDTLSRAMAKMDPDEYEAAFRYWACALAKDKALQEDLHDRKIIAMDGKAVRCASRKHNRIILVGVWDEQSNVAIATEQVEKKSNEIKAIPKLVSSLDIAGSILTMDAMGCQHEIAKIIRENNADYLLSLKGNQKFSMESVMSNIEKLITEQSNLLTFSETTDEAHGRKEIRKCWACNCIIGFSDLDKWTDLNTVLMVKSERTVKGGTTTSETRVYISSANLNAKEGLNIIRRHWGIENKLHYRLDTQMKEDQSSARAGNAARNLSITRRITLNILIAEYSNGGLDRNRRRLLLSKSKRERVVAKYVMKFPEQNKDEMLAQRKAS